MLSNSKYFLSISSSWQQLSFGGNQLGSAAINISNHDVASSGRQDRYNRKGWLGGMSQVAEGGEGSRGGNISQRRLLAFPFRYPSSYLWSFTIGDCKTEDIVFFFPVLEQDRIGNICFKIFETYIFS